MSNLGLEYRALFLQEQRTCPTNQQGPAYKTIQSAQQLQRCVNDVLQPTNWTQLQTASVDPLGVLRRAILSGSQCFYLLTECRHILLNSAILKLDLTFMDTVRSARELRALIFAWENHMKLRLWRRELDPRRLARSLREALRGMKSSFTDLRGVLDDHCFIATCSIMSIEQQVIHNMLNSFVRLQACANLVSPVSAFTSGTLLTTLQRRIEVVVRSGRQVQGVASSLREFRRESIIPRQRVRESLSRPTKQQATK